MNFMDRVVIRGAYLASIILVVRGCDPLHGLLVVALISAVAALFAVLEKGGKS